MSCEYVREYYKVPACIGRRIKYTSPKSGMREGVIYEDGGNYISVNFDKDKPGQTVNIHPTDPGLEYLEMGKCRKMTRSQQRYQEYIRSEVCESFAEWLGIRPKKDPMFDY